MERSCITHDSETRLGLLMDTASISRLKRLTIEIEDIEYIVRFSDKPGIRALSVPQPPISKCLSDVQGF